MRRLGYVVFASVLGSAFWSGPFCASAAASPSWSCQMRAVAFASLSSSVEGLSEDAASPMVKIRELMQDCNYAGAIAAIDAAMKTPQANQDELAYLRARAQFLAKDYAGSIRAFAEFETAYPKSVWKQRAKYGQAIACLRAGDFKQAEQIYRTQVTHLLSEDRKHEIASIYLEFADRLFQPKNEVQRPDYSRALPFYRKALEIGPKPAVKREVELKVGQCLEKQNDFNGAASVYSAFVKDAVKDSLTIEARFRLGECKLKLNDAREARRVWQDLITDFADSKSERIAQATFEIAKTYGMPQPGSDEDLSLGRSALESFLKRYPDNKLASKAQLWIAEGAMHRGRYDETIDALKRFLSEERYSKSEEVPEARHLLGRSYLLQKRFDEAIAAWREYLAKHPSHEKWSKVQASIIETEYLMGFEKRKDRKYDEARNLWTTFLAKYPLDPRGRQILFDFGQMEYELNNWQKAIEEWTKLVAKYPGSEESSHAQLSIGLTLEEKFAKLDDAIKAYRKLNWGTYAAAAQQRISQLTAKTMALSTERIFRSDEPAKLRLSTRNIDTVTVRVYNVDLETYFRKMHLASGVEKLDVALIDPDKTFELKIPGYAEFKGITSEIVLPALASGKKSGVLAVNVSSKSLEATTMVVQSDLDIVVKCSRDELFVYAQDMRTGKPWKDAKLLLSNGQKVFSEEKTGEDGTFKKSFTELSDPNDVRVFAIADGHTASNVVSLQGVGAAQGLEPTGYVVTDRPAYRSGQMVNIRGVIRLVANDQFTVPKGEKYTVSVVDPRNRMLSESKVELNEFGSFHAHLILPSVAVTGDYRILAQPANGPGFEGKFQVVEYQLEPIKLAVETGKKVYFRGETIEGKIKAQFYYGAPLAGREIRYQLADQPVQTGTTDAKGEIAFKFPTREFRETQMLPLNVSLTERNLSITEGLFLATKEFSASLSTIRPVYIAGESFEVTVRTSSVEGKPLAKEMTVKVFEVTNVHGVAGERLVSTKQVTTGEKEGVGRVTFKLDSGATYTVRAEGKDRFNNIISGTHQVSISDDKDQTRLRILAEKHTYKVGDNAKISIHWREKDSLALITYQGARILGHRLVELKNGFNVVEVPMTTALAPNFDFAVTVMTDPRELAASGTSKTGEAAILVVDTTKPIKPRLRFHEAASPFELQKNLQIAIRTKRKDNSDAPVRPGDDVEVTLTVTDPQGKPVVGELSLALIEQALVDRFSENLGAISAYFQGNRRTSAMRTTSSVTFAYYPSTKPINSRLLAEEERRELAAAEVAHVRSSTGIPLTRSPLDLADAPLAGIESPPSPVLVQPQSAGTEGAQRRMRSARAPGGGGGGMVNRAVPSTMPADPQRVEMAQQPRFQRGLANEPRNVAQNDELLSGDGAKRKANQDFESASDTGFRQKALPDDPYGDDDQGVAKQKALGGTLVAEHQKQLSYAPTPELMGKLASQGHNDVQAYLETGCVVNVNLGRANRGEGMNTAELSKLLKDQGAVLMPALGPSETGYWNPQIVTNEQGVATLVVTMPDRTTTWKLFAKGITKETLAGEAESALTVKKDLFGELKLPMAFTDGDKATILATVHNDAVENGEIEVILRTTVGERITPEKQVIKVNSKGIQEVPFRIALDRPNNSKHSGPEVNATFELTIVAGKITDVVQRSVPVRPYGMPVFRTAGGSASGDATAWVEPIADMKVASPTLEILIGPTVEKSLMDVLLGQPLWCQREMSSFASGLEQSSSDILASAGLLKLLKGTRDATNPHAQAIDSRIRSSISLLVASQNDDGGWSWGGKGGASNRYASARVVWALAVAKSIGYSVPADRYQLAITYLNTQLAATSHADYESKAVLLHSLSTAGRGDFMLANRLHRSRPSLSNAALAYLALAFLEMNRAPMANELLDILAKRNLDPTKAKKDLVSALPWNDSSVEVRALYCLALQRANVQPTKAKELADWLLAHRSGHRWAPDKATGPATLALADWFAKTRIQNEHFKLSILVNGAEVKSLDIDDATGTQSILVPSEKLIGNRERVQFVMNGRGRFTYQCILGGFVPADKLVKTTTDWRVERRYEPAPLEVDGKEIPRGFSVIQSGYTPFHNPLTQLPVGKRAHVTINPIRVNQASRPTDEQLEYLVVTEPLPSGATVIEQSVKGGYERFEVGPSNITFYIGNRRHIETIQFDIHGYVPGQFRTGPTVMYNAYEPNEFAVSQPKELKVLAAGAKSEDAYRLTPQEQFEIGKIHFEKKRWRECIEMLSELYTKWSLTPDAYRETARLLMNCHLQIGPSAEIVRYFEVIKEKWPDLEMPFSDIVKVGTAYEEMGEYERSYMVFRTTAESSFDRESGVAGFLEQQGEFLRSVQVMSHLLLEYPAESYTAAGSYALAQRVYAKAPEAINDMKLKEKGIYRADLIRQSLAMLNSFLTEYPEDPAADQASFAVANGLLDLKKYRETITASMKFVGRYPTSDLLDSFWYLVGFCHFALNEHQQALDVCRKVAQTERVDKRTGAKVESPNKWEAIYILGQVYHSLGKAAQAIEEYSKVADRFADAKQAIDYFIRKDISLQEVVTFKPGETASIEVKFRNIERCDIKVYRIDLMKLGLLERNLSGITRVNLAGIHPLVEKVLELGDGKDYRDRTQKVELALKDEGAYLVVCRGADIHVSGLLLITPLVVEVQEEASSGRVRTTIKDAVKGAYVSGVGVRVIGSLNTDFVAGETDLRGVHVADGISGVTTVIAQSNNGRYAFYRGTLPLGAIAQNVAPVNKPGAPQMDRMKSMEENLLDNVRGANRAIQQGQEMQLKRQYDKGGKGVRPDAVK